MLVGNVLKTINSNEVLLSCIWLLTYTILIIYIQENMHWKWVQCEILQIERSNTRLQQSLTTKLMQSIGTKIPKKQTHLKAWTKTRLV